MNVCLLQILCIYHCINVNVKIKELFSRSRSMADRSLGPHGGRHHSQKHNFVESLLKQSLPRRSSFSFGSKLFKSKSSSHSSFSDSASSSGSSVSCCQHNKGTEEFWNQYRRNHHPRFGFGLRGKQVPPRPLKPANSIHEKCPPTHNTISL